MAAFSATATLNVALADLHALAKDLGCDLDIRIRFDGRVQFEFITLHGYVKHVVRSDLFTGGADPRPGEALGLAKFAQGTPSSQPPEKAS
jgi:hypothetical protein